jgi:DUF917 family protein
VQGTEADERRRVRLELDSEFLMAMEDGVARATVPDLVCVLSSQTSAPVQTGNLHHGQRVTALAAPCPEVWRSERGLALVGPEAFGLDLEYHAVGAEGDRAGG